MLKQIWSVDIILDTIDFILSCFDSNISSTVIYFCIPIFLLIALILFSGKKLTEEELKGFTIDDLEIDKTKEYKAPDFSNITYVPGWGHPGDSSRGLNPVHPYFGPDLPPHFTSKKISFFNLKWSFNSPPRPYTFVNLSLQSIVI